MGRSPTIWAIWTGFCAAFRPEDRHGGATPESQRLGSPHHSADFPMGPQGRCGMARIGRLLLSTGVVEADTEADAAPAEATALPLFGGVIIPQRITPE